MAESEPTSILSMLADGVRWHRLETWRPLLCCDEDQEAKRTRDPVALAQRSERPLEKVHSKTRWTNGVRSTASRRAYELLETIKA